MDKGKPEYRTIDEYIKSCPGNTHSKLKQLRSLIKRIAPGAQEKISYQMPTFYLNGNLVHFAAYENHIGFISRRSFPNIRAPRAPCNFH